MLRNLPKYVSLLCEYMHACMCTRADRSEDSLAVVSSHPCGSRRSVCPAWQPVSLHTEPSRQHQDLTLASGVGKGSDGSPRPALGKCQGTREGPREVLEPSPVKYELASSLDFWVGGDVGVTGCFVNKENSLGGSVLRCHLHQQALPSWFPTFSLCAPTLSQASDWQALARLLWGQWPLQLWKARSLLQRPLSHLFLAFVFVVLRCTESTLSPSGRQNQTNPARALCGKCP